MKSRRAWLVTGSLIATFFVAGCASTKRAEGQKSTELSTWRGRLSLRVQAEPGQGKAQDQSFSAAFELQGNPTLGTLHFFTPLGSTAAVIDWSPVGAVLQARGETREFSDLAQLLQLLLGTDVPVTALFAWLAGTPQAVDGWLVDLSQQTQGRITARRTTPAPVAELRVLLDD